MNKKIIWIIIIIVVIIAIIFAINKKPTVTSTTPYKIGAAYTLTGDAAIWGEAAQNGTKLAIKEINDGGGIDGRKVDLIVEDSKSTSKDSISAVSKLQNIDNVDAILITWLDVYGGAESVIKPNTLMISPDAGIEGVNGTKLHPNVFSTWYRTEPKSELAIKHMAEHGKKKLYIIAQNDSYYLSAVSFMEDAARRYGVEIIGKDLLSSGTDMASILVKVKAKKPDAVFVALYDEKENVDFLKKWKPLIGSDIAIYGDEFIQQNYTRTDYNPSWFEGFYFYGPQTPDSRFFNAYKAAYGTDPVFGASTAYDAVYMIARAFKDKPKDLNTYMRSTTFNTVSYGNATFDAIGGVTTPENYFVMKQIKDGKPIMVN